MAQCHIKKGNWKRAGETADEVCQTHILLSSLAHGSYAEQALRLNPKNYKAMFRKARALKEQGYFEKAEKTLEELIKDGDPNGMSSYLRRHVSGGDPSVL